MTDQTTPETGAQPSADATTVESILNSAVPEPQTEEPAQEIENTEQETPLDPGAEKKKLENAISHQKGQAAKWRHQAQQARAEATAFAAEIAKLKQPAQKSGPPKEADYTNYAEYLEAKNTHAIEQKFAERDSKQQETQKATDQQAYYNSRIAEVDKQAEAFTKEFPEIEAIYNEHAETITDYSPELKRLFLDADNAPLAFYNLAKEGKLEALGTMSLAKAAMEIGRAQAQAVVKPKSKAPAPLPAARGSVPAGKSLEQLTALEAHKLLSQKD